MKNFRKFAFSSCHFAMPPLGGAAKVFNMGVQLHSLHYAKASKVRLNLYDIYWFDTVLCPYANSYSPGLSYAWDYF